MGTLGYRAEIAGMLVTATGLTGIGSMVIVMAGPIGKGVEVERGSIIETPGY
jgi:hypothetical protein